MKMKEFHKRGFRKQPQRAERTGRSRKMSCHQNFLDIVYLHQYNEQVRGFYSTLIFDAKQPH